jgi:hypothetical protein
MLLSSEHGHFSLVKSVPPTFPPRSQLNLMLNRALHLADLVTEMNGKMPLVYRKLLGTQIANFFP